MALAAVGVAFTWQLRIVDVALSHGQTVVVLNKQQRLVGMWRSSWPLRLSGCENPILSKKWRARWVNENTLELLDKSGNPITQRTDTSVGVMTVPPLSACLHLTFVLPQRARHGQRHPVTSSSARRGEATRDIIDASAQAF